MKKISLLLALFAFITSDGQTLNKYWVMFKDKAGTPYSTSTPTAYLSPKSIARRTAQGIAINSSDLPVTPSYVSQVAAVPSVTVLYRSKWLNGVVVKTTSTGIAAINTLTFVASTNKVNKYTISLSLTNQAAATPGTADKITQTQTTGYNYGSSALQANMIGVSCMHNAGYRGQNMTIAVMDIGFYRVNLNPVFDSLFLENRLLGTRDFVNGDTLVFEDGTETHGTEVLSTMAGNKPGTIIGTAPKASYWLLKTEDGYSETISEEYNWVRAAEFADSVGADICTTSLGYNQFDGGLNDHTYADMTGRKAPMSIAANMAARKGMFVLNAAGNEGQSTWHYICAPADADSICTVGAVDPRGKHAYFSSFGPTADGRIKPDLCSLGDSAFVSDPSGNVFAGNGTSFATPILAGAVACLWQYSKFATNMQILAALKSSATRSLTPNDSTGWGIPQVCAATTSTILGVAQLSKEAGPQINLYPNPVGNALTVSSSLQELLAIKVTDVLGNEQKCETESHNNGTLYFVNTAALPAGVYFVNLVGSGRVITKKFVKQ